jgi:hypothetical protein
MLYRVNISTDCGFGLPIYGRTLFEIMTLAWPLIQTWKRKYKKDKPLALLQIEYQGLVMENYFHHIKQDDVSEFLFDAMGYKRAS